MRFRSDTQTLPAALAVVVFTAALVAPTGCTADADSAIETRGEATSYVLAEQVDRGVGTRVNLAEIVPFRWERLYVFGPRTPVAAVRDSVGAQWRALARYGGATPDTANLLVFVAGGRVLAAVAHPRRYGDVAPARAGRGYSPAEATFVVDSVDAGFGRRVLR